MTSTNAPTVDSNGYYLDEVSAGFEAGANKMMEQLKLTMQIMVQFLK